MDSSLERESKRARRVCDQALLPGGMLAIRLDPSYGHLPQRPTTCKPICILHWWAGVETRTSVMFCPTCNVNLCLHCYRFLYQNVNIVQTKKILYNQFAHPKEQK